MGKAAFQIGTIFKQDLSLVFEHEVLKINKLKQVLMVEEDKLEQKKKKSLMMEHICKRIF